MLAKWHCSYLSSIDDIFHRLGDLFGRFHELFLALRVRKRRRDDLGARDQL